MTWPRIFPPKWPLPCALITPLHHSTTTAADSKTHACTLFFKKKCMYKQIKQQPPPFPSVLVASNSCRTMPTYSYSPIQNTQTFSYWSIGGVAWWWLFCCTGCFFSGWRRHRRTRTTSMMPPFLLLFSFSFFSLSFLQKHRHSFLLFSLALVYKDALSLSWYGGIKVWSISNPFIKLAYITATCWHNCSTK